MCDTCDLSNNIKDTQHRKFMYTYFKQDQYKDIYDLAFNDLKEWKSST